MKRHAPRLTRLGAVLAGAVFVASCSETRAGPPEAGRRAMPVQVIEAQKRPVEDASEYMATMDSRRAVELLPQVDGRITRIFVHSGDAVRAGAPIVEIDPREQQAEVASAEDQRRAAEASLALALRVYQRAKALFERGATTQQDFDQARASYETAQANLAAQSSKVKSQQVQLKYFTVVAPFEGVVGDVRARVGDRVTTDTALTTIDQTKRLQLYVYVPRERSAQLKLGLLVGIVDDTGKVIDQGQLDFISPRVERDTQTVLVKATFPNEDGRLRQAQAVRARLVFAVQEQVVVPITAVSRLGAQSFVFVAERQGPFAVARRRPIEVGPISGNDYPVLRGVSPGDLVVVSGTQKLADGAPVQFLPDAAAP